MRVDEYQQVCPDSRVPNTRFIRTVLNLISRERAAELYGPWGVEYSPDLATSMLDAYIPSHPENGTVLEEIVDIGGDGTDRDEQRLLLHCLANPTLPPRTMTLKRLWDGAPTSPPAPTEQV